MSLISFNNNPSQPERWLPVGLNVATAAPAIAPQRLIAGVPTFDEFLEGGLRFGEVSEWGVPWGRGGRDVVLAFLASATAGRQLRSPLWCLWVHSDPQTVVYPLAWQARGIDLNHVRFAYSAKPIRDLKPVFLEPFFTVIVLDAPKPCSEDDCAFLARQARRNGQAILLLRDYFLSARRGNVWAKLRLNCWREEATSKVFARVVRGLSPRQLSFTIDAGRP